MCHDFDSVTMFMKSSDVVTVLDYCIQVHKVQFVLRGLSPLFLPTQQMALKYVCYTAKCGFYN